MNSWICTSDIGKFSRLITYPHVPYPTCTLPITYEQHTGLPTHPIPRGFSSSAEYARILARDKSKIYRRIKTTHGTSPRRRGAKPPQWTAPSAIATVPRQSRLAPTQPEAAQQRGDRRTPHQLRPETTLPQQSNYRPAHSLFTLRIAHSSESRHVPARFLERRAGCACGPYGPEL
jgi:hypothetical protein